MRYHFMDSLRAAMMVAGVFYHASLVYAPGLTWRFRDPGDAAVLTWISSVLHAFRMPAFFVVAGFFFAFILSRDASVRKLLSRLLVFAVPFVAMMFTLQPLQYMLKLEAQGAFEGVDARFWQAYFSRGEYISHLWFLVNLAFYYAAGWFLLPAERVRRLLDTAGVLQLFRSKTALAAAACAFFLPWLVLTRELSFSESYDAAHVFQYAPYFVAGFAIFGRRALFDAFRRVGVVDVLVLGVLLAIDYRDPPGPAGRVLGLLAYYQCAFVLSALCMELFYRFLDRASALSRMVSDAAYTIYLFHHVLVVAAAMAVAHLLPRLHALAKYALVVGAVLSVTLAIHLLVVARVPLLRLLFNGRLPARLQLQPAGR